MTEFFNRSSKPLAMRIKIIKTSITILFSFLLSAGYHFSVASEIHDNTPFFADTIYWGGDILTMDPAQAVVEAVAIKDGRILARGSQSQIKEFESEHTQIINLGGATMLPGFIDAHGHFGATGLLARSAYLAAAPDGDTNNFDRLIYNLKQHRDSDLTKELGWILGMNYDDSQLDEKAHPTAKDLDKVSAEIPIMVLHQSGHLGVVNSKGLEVLGYTAETPDPEGGKIRRMPGGQQPNGVLEETALFAPLLKLISPKSADSLYELMQSAQQAYVKAGFTTAQEGRATPAGIHGLQAVAAAKRLAIDVVAYPDPTFYADDSAFNEAMKQYSLEYSNHYRLGGLKLSLDGSPQAKTAWLSHPYHIVPEGHDDEYLGYPALKDEVVDHYIQLAIRQNWQILVHTNGDAASDQYIRTLRRGLNNNEHSDFRPVAIHAQIIRDDQLDQLKSLGVIPSFMTVHTFYWGDWHRDSVLGQKRARRISPTRSALERAMIYTSHNDAPVTLPNAMMILSSQVNRTTRSGKIIGEEQRVTVMEALKSITSNAAYQYFEEGQKGSIKEGKLADLVILSDNPLKIDPSELRSIKVLETIKEGNSVYKLR